MPSTAPALVWSWVRRPRPSRVTWNAASNPKAGDRFRQLKTRAFPDDETFFCVDLSALGKLAGRRHDRLVEILASRKNRPAADVDRDLSQVLAFARLFEAAYVTSRFEPEAAAVHRRIGLDPARRTGRATMQSPRCGPVDMR